MNKHTSYPIMSTSETKPVDFEIITTCVMLSTYTVAYYNKNIIIRSSDTKINSDK